MNAVVLKTLGFERRQVRAALGAVALMNGVASLPSVLLFPPIAFALRRRALRRALD